MPPTHYQLLDIPPTATAEQIRRTYRALAKTLHPDVNPSKDAVKRFAKLAAAYEILSDPDKRRAYDRRLAAHAIPQPTADEVRQAHYAWDNIAAQKRAPAVDISEVDELYDTFFARSSRSKANPKPAPRPKAAPKPARKRAS